MREDSEDSPPAQGLPWLALLVAAAGAWLSADLTQGLVDDAFISMRFARNLAEGAGPVFNPGERVEGFTSPLWVLVGAALHRWAPDPVAATRWVGLVAGALLFPATYCVARRNLGLGSRSGVLAASLLLPHAALLAWAGSGMETTTFALLGALLVLAAGRLERPGAPALAAALGGLVAWVRPEGLALAPLTLAAGTGSLRQRASAAAGALAAGAALLVLRRGYYGEWLPNTFFAKVPRGPEQLVWGLEYLGTSAFDFGFCLVPALAAFAAWRTRAWRPGPARPLLAWVGLSALVVVAEGGDNLPLGRFVVHLLPGIAALAAAGLGEWRAGRQRRDLVELCLVTLVVAAFVTRPDRLEPMLRFRAQTARYRALGAALAAAEPAARVLATSGAGAMPYQTGWTTIDTVGLCDRHIARSPFDPLALRGHQRGDPDYVLGRRPDLLVLGLLGVPEGPLRDPRQVPLEQLVGRTMAFPTARGLWQDPRFIAGWEPAAADLGPLGRSLYFRRRDLDARP